MLAQRPRRWASFEPALEFVGLGAPDYRDTQSVHTARMSPDAPSPQGRELVPPEYVHPRPATNTRRLCKSGEHRIQAYNPRGYET